MSNETEDLALSAANYSPPVNAASNADLAEYVRAQVEAALAQAQAAQAAANAPKVVSPAEAARAAIDNRGAGLGVDERLNELYALVHLLAQNQGV